MFVTAFSLENTMRVILDDAPEKALTVFLTYIQSIEIKNDNKIVPTSNSFGYAVKALLKLWTLRQASITIFPL